MIAQETCRVGADHFTSHHGKVDHFGSSTPATTVDRPALVSFGGLPRFSEVFSLISGFTFYSPIPEKMRIPTTLGAGKVLLSDASNAADVFARIRRSRPDVASRLNGYLTSSIPLSGNLDSPNPSTTGGSRSARRKPCFLASEWCRRLRRNSSGHRHPSRDLSGQYRQPALVPRLPGGA